MNINNFNIKSNAFHFHSVNSNHSSKSLFKYGIIAIVKFTDPCDKEDNLKPINKSTK